MITVTNIETFHDHFAHYEKVTVVGVVAVAGVVTGAPNENIVQSHLNIALLNVF